MEGVIADGQHFVDQEDVVFEVGGDGEGKANGHAARIPFDGGIDELLELGKGDDLVEFAFDLAAPHAENGAVEVDVFAAGEFGMKAGANFEQRTNPPPNEGPAGARLGDAGEQLEQGGFAGAITADHAHNFTAANGEGDIPQGPKYIFVLQASAAAPQRGAQTAPGSARCVGEALAQGLVPRLGRPDPVLFGQTLDRDRQVRHRPPMLAASAPEDGGVFSE